MARRKCYTIPNPRNHPLEERVDETVQNSFRIVPVLTRRLFAYGTGRRRLTSCHRSYPAVIEKKRNVDLTGEL